MEQYQDSKIKSIENQVKSVMIQNARKHIDLDDGDRSNMKCLNITGLENEMDTIRNGLLQAKNALSPRKIQFKKISAGSLDSSVVVMNGNNKSIHKSRLSTFKENQEPSHPMTTKSVGRRFKSPVTPVPSNGNQRVIAKSQNFVVQKDPFETSAIARLRNDLQSLESNYKHTKKVNKQRYKAVTGNSLESSSVI